MSRSEEPIDKILAGLRNAQAPSGLEQRVLRALEERSDHGEQRAWRWLSRAKVTPPLTLTREPIWIGSFTALGLLALLFAMAIPHPAPRRIAVTNPPTRQGMTPVAKLRSDPVQTSIKVSRAAHTQRAYPPSVTNAEESLAMEEMRAPSLVAPPLPLTAQERALLRIGQRRRPDAVAVLDAEHRAREQAQATTEFYDFFEPAKPAKSIN